MLKKLQHIICLKQAKQLIADNINITDTHELMTIGFEKYNKLRNDAITEIANELNVARGTVTRWIELKNVPEQYSFELMKIAGETIDYSKFTPKQKDQFFTSEKDVNHCFNVFKNYMSSVGETIKDYWFIEPSAGDGAFLNVLPSNKTIALDIEPNHKNIIQTDYFDWMPTKGDRKYIVFGNPPFGLRGHLALKFIEHSYEFADYVCFILPQLFESDGKGSPRKRISNYNLVHSEKLNTFFHDPSGKEMKINVVFQIWSKYNNNPRYDIKQYDNSVCNVYSLSNGDSPSQQRNTDKIGKCDFYLPSTCFGADNMKSYDSFEELPGLKGYGIVLNKNRDKLLPAIKQTKWSDVAFLSTNSALNLRTSNIKERIIFLFDKHKQT
jgi:hypothetical protein